MSLCEQCQCHLGHHLYDCPSLTKMEPSMQTDSADILAFFGEHRWLSNFWLCSIHFDGVDYRSVEHAYQAAKSLDQNVRLQVRDAVSCKVAKRLGTVIEIRPNWDTLKLEVMEECLRQKFAAGSALHAQLKATKGLLVEGNYWHDNFWGVCVCEKCNGTGLNHLGNLLMQIRDED